MFQILAEIVLFLDVEPVQIEIYAVLTEVSRFDSHSQECWSLGSIRIYSTIY